MIHDCVINGMVFFDNFFRSSLGLKDLAENGQ